MTRARAIAALVAGLLGAAEPALACKCALVPRDRAIAAVPLVFHGRIVRIETAPETTPKSGPGDQVTTMTVVRNVKGMARARTVKVRSHTQSASCGYDFRDVEGTVLVGASRSDDGMLTVRRCVMYNLNR